MSLYICLVSLMRITFLHVVSFYSCKSLHILFLISCSNNYGLYFLYSIMYSLSFTYSLFLYFGAWKYFWCSERHSLVLYMDWLLQHLAILHFKGLLSVDLDFSFLVCCLHHFCFFFFNLRSSTSVTNTSLLFCRGSTFSANCFCS